MSKADFLLELGCEELPPKSLQELANSLLNSIQKQLDEAGLAYDQLTSYATPRRLALLISGLAKFQPDQNIERRGPSLQAAYVEEGVPTQAALGFAASCGVELSALQTLTTPKGSWLVYRNQQAGQAAQELLPEIINKAFNQLPIAKRMRWGTSRIEFSRPTQWLVLLHGSEVVPATILGLVADRITYGHRFHAPEPIQLNNPAEYLSRLYAAKVIANFEQRQQAIQEQVKAEACKHQATAVIDADLLNEVTGLVEWPIALTGSFDADFLQLPAACLISSMQANQKYFHYLDTQGQLLPLFTTISNIASKQPELVIAGNEKVIRPRLADAAFFFNQDQKIRLAERFANLEQVVFQQQLGSLAEKSQRIANLAEIIAKKLGADLELVKRAARLCKCDLSTAMVQEFAELQGIMGATYARLDGEPEEVCLAISEHYLPRNPQDKLPSTLTGISLALADRLDTLTGIFGIGQKPTGVKDPFALRRSALAVLNILVNLKLDLDLQELIQLALQQHSNLPKAATVEQELLDYMLDRFRAWYSAQAIGVDIFLAVRAKGISHPYDFDRRVQAVASFVQLEESQSLTAASKRVNNLLSKNKVASQIKFNPDLITETAEAQLAEQLADIQKEIRPLYAQGDYQAALHLLAKLKTTVDNFFDAVMVMAEDAKLRNNRLALLNQLQEVFMYTADISQLQH